jgi:hypothetical protein
MNDTDREVEQAQDLAAVIDGTAEWIDRAAEEIDAAAEDVVTRRIKVVAETVVALRKGLIGPDGPDHDYDHDYMDDIDAMALQLALRHGAQTLVKLYKLAAFPRR